ncbi:MAG: prephenate dehydratase, partial [Pirellulaceae bacterium]|nr:prephenate dehydratase [Pirellulaceae bacterium]
DERLGRDAAPRRQGRLRLGHREEHTAKADLVLCADRNPLIRALDGSAAQPAAAHEHMVTLPLLHYRLSGDLIVTMVRSMATDSQEQLAPLRQRIDELDKRIVDLLNERANAVKQIGMVKQRTDTPIYAPDREQRVLQQIRQYNRGLLSDSCLEAIWREVMSASFALERPLRVGFLGPMGSFSHLTARRKFGASVLYDPLDSIQCVFDQVVRDHIDLGLVPIENSTHGGVHETLDALLDSPVHVYAEVLIGVHHNVLSNCSVDQIKRVYSKPEVFSQCRRWLNAKLPQAERIPEASSARAAERCSSEPNSAAIGSSLAAELYGLHVQFANIEDNPSNTTRFFVISSRTANASGDDKTAMLFTTAHQPGALVAVLDVFRDHGLNLTHIDKRPSPHVNWEYFFFIDLLGHCLDSNIERAIEKARKHCLQLTVLGSFPRAKEVM